MPKIKEVKKKDGTTVYKAQVYLGINPATGKPKYTTITGDAYKQVEDEISKTAADRVDKKTVKNSNITFQMAYQEWFAVHKKTVKPSTVETVESKVKTVLPYLAHYKVKKITPVICQNMLTDLIENKGYKRSSVSNYRLYCNMIFHYCIKNDYLSKNPMQYVQVPKTMNDFLYSEDDEQKKRKYWLKSEVLEFLQLAEKELKFFDYVMFRILLFSGMRKGELHALHWNDIDFVTGEVRIAKTLVNINKEDILQKPKSKASNRSIILDGKTLDLLNQWKQFIREEYIAFGNRKLWDNNPPVFSEPSGKYFTLSHLNNVMNYNFYIHHPDFYKITIHQMRHTHASLLFESGASLKDVQAKLGHEEIQTTMNIYTHVTETKSKKTVDDFAKFMDI